MPYHLTTTKKILLITVLCAALLWSNASQLHRLWLLTNCETETLVQIEEMPLLLHPEMLEPGISIPAPELELMEEKLLQKEELLKELEQKLEKITIE
ncbi:hypothetical protein ESA94_06130 [Lacibacter luteus]|uniref:Uncharacterized protein n=1 Tax=Lacibacter luteus TaxID=2508719 RepID=A0A4Q1CNZ8_9BACT|nr:hypothetical protein [Lacibacter luteus]RXK62574.1 hypothetical protein ESA94_06130 [Lacibacter luteus]